MSDNGKNRGLTADPERQFHYGTFQGVANYYPPPPVVPPHLVVGIPQPVPPQASIPNSHFPYGYQTVAGYAVTEGRLEREHRIPCCGMGMGWVLFIIGFFLGGIPWYVGTFILLCVRVDYREKPGYVACAIASILAMLAVTLGATRGSNIW
ncbi:hypothetical protein HS088_TW14G00462 [Tripterygium wilfordii]|uniref:60S ribosomal protein L18a-like protein n=1 Tax=Tripterygium wilfordii TaxID=458696 RepID=A0A7J7CQD7_TRIWF|nr:hypothetical protein HS088_TW14G00462 [Tripterygium wilfordii]